MAYGNVAGIVVIDIEQKVCLLNVGSPDLYGAQDPYSRVPRSPKKGQLNLSEQLPVSSDRDERQPQSPSIDQVSDAAVLHLLLSIEICPSLGRSLGLKHDDWDLFWFCYYITSFPRQDVNCKFVVIVGYHLVNVGVCIRFKLFFAGLLMSC